MITAKQDLRTSDKINAIRKAAGNSGHVCPLCGKAANSPYRRFVAGKVYEGCVDAFHTPAMRGAVAAAAYGPTVEWHTREAACQLRRDELRALESL